MLKISHPKHLSTKEAFSGMRRYGSHVWFT